MHLKLSYTSEWRHIPSDETHRIDSTYDLYKAVEQFRERHDSHGAVTMFVIIKIALVSITI
jgi:hypothetical protein